MADDEVVWCVPKTVVPFDVINRFSTCGVASLPEVLAHKVLVPRSRCETDETLLQVIPYIVVICNDHVMAYKRGTAGEPRLNAKESIGFGGHLNDGDKSYFAGLEREGREELIGFHVSKVSQPLGFIYDNTNAVGRVHLGVLHGYGFGDAPVAPAEVHSHYWIRIRHAATSETMERWSRIAASMVMECLNEDYDDDSDRQATRQPDETAVAPDCHGVE